MRRAVAASLPPFPGLRCRCKGAWQFSRSLGPPQVYVEEVVLLSTVNLGASLLYKVPTGSGPPQVTYDDVAQQMYAVRPASPPSHIVFDAPLCELCRTARTPSFRCKGWPAVHNRNRHRWAAQAKSHGTGALSQRHIIFHECQRYQHTTTSSPGSAVANCIPVPLPTDKSCCADPNRQ